MYNNAAASGGTLAVTGAGLGVWFDAVWLFLAAFAIIAGVMAVGRILPKF